METKETKRLGILAKAKEQVMLGAHYLRGGVGNTPGYADGYKGEKRWASLENDATYDGLAVQAAELWNKRCCGRYGKVSGEKMAPGKVTKAAIEEYIARESSRTPYPSAWMPFYGLCYPRRLKGAGSSIYLGESCAGKRHFDCLGLVNWAIGQVLATKPSYDVPVWEKGACGFAEVFDPPEVGGLENADVVIKVTRKTQLNEDGEEEQVIASEHMALVTKEGQVIEASGDSGGVEVTPYRKEKWTKVARIKSMYF